MIRTTTAAHASRGYLLSWLGALVGTLPAVLFPLAVVRGACGGPNSCGFGEGILVIGVIWVGMIVATVVGLPFGVYVALRMTRRAFAGLTAWMFVLVLGGLLVLQAAFGRFFDGTPVSSTPWVLLMTVGILSSPVIARHFALCAADSLRKYR
jgi:hypothetical protein